MDFVRLFVPGRNQFTLRDVVLGGSILDGRSILGSRAFGFRHVLDDMTAGLSDMSPFRLRIHQAGGGGTARAAQLRDRHD